MRTQRSKVFALLSDDITTTPFAGQILQGAQVAAWRHEMLLLPLRTGAESALERGVEGIIFATDTRQHHPGFFNRSFCLFFQTCRSLR
jgi:DNA-binding LacI/PurR family transcriptional regulator